MISVMKARDRKKIELYRRAIVQLRQALGAASDPELLTIVHTLENRVQTLLLDDKSDKNYDSGETRDLSEILVIIKAICKDKPTMSEYIERLEGQGVLVKAFMDEARVMRGLRYEYKGRAFSSKQLGGKFSWKRLPEIGIGYEPDRDMPALIKRAVFPMNVQAVQSTDSSVSVP